MILHYPFVQGLLHETIKCLIRSSTNHKYDGISSPLAEKLGHTEMITTSTLNSAPPAGKNCPHQRHRRGFPRDLGLFERQFQSLKGNSYLSLSGNCGFFYLQWRVVLFCDKKLESWFSTEVFFPQWTNVDVRRIPPPRKLFTLVFHIPLEKVF